MAAPSNFRNRRNGMHFMKLHLADFSGAMSVAHEAENSASAMPIPTPTPPSFPLTSSQIAKLLRGFKLREMEDKWFVYSSGPDEKGKISVNFFRSWTGLKFAEMEVRVVKENGEGEGDGHGEITGLIWESSLERVGEQDEEGVKETVIGVCKWVLEVEPPGFKDD